MRIFVQFQYNYFWEIYYIGNETALLPVNQPFTMTGALEISAPAGRGDLRQAV